MKRYQIFIAVWLVLAINFTLFLAPAGKTLSSRAEGETYAVAENSDVWFYKTEDENDKLFCIPRTYYVKVISRGERFSFCEYLKDNAPYKKVSGYCLTNSLTFVDFVPQRPYLFREVTVEYTIPLRAELGSGKFTTLKSNFVYYGTRRSESDQLHFYVCKDGEFDYIPAAEDISYELNDDFTTDTFAPAAAVGSKSSDGLSAVQIVLITLSAVAVLVVAVFVAHGRRSAPPENFEP